MTLDPHDPLARLMRAADPHPGAEDAPLTMRQLEIGDRIADQSPARSKGWVWWPAVLTPALAALVVAIVVLLTVVTPVSPPPVAAVLTPPRLVFTADGRSVAQVITDAQSLLAGPGAVNAAERRVVTTGWYFQTEDADADEPVSVISPEVSTLEWAPDGSGSVRIVAGDPYWADGSAAPVPVTTTPAGTVVSEMTFQPGEFQAPLPDPPGDAMSAFLAAYGLSDATSGFEVATTIETVLQYWTVTDEDEAAMLDFLAAADGISVLGTTTDRAGRPIVGLSAEVPGGKGERHVFLSRETGRIVGFETVTTARDGIYPADAVISYTLLDLNP